MKSQGVRWLALSFFLLPLLVLSAHAGSVDLGTAGSYAVLGGSAITNTGSSVPQRKPGRQRRLLDKRLSSGDRERNDQRMQRARRSGSA